jgi:hypothetical protein
MTAFRLTTALAAIVAAAFAVALAPRLEPLHRLPARR